MSESFEEVCASYGDCTWIGRDGVNEAIDRLKKAHEHDMEQMRKASFHKGYVAGQRSMDAEHQAVALRLRQLPLDGDSHANLSAIAGAIWHSDFGWTCGACKVLRDKIIELLGGVHDESGSVGGACCSSDADCVCGNGEQGRLTEYDVLDNERHEAVCRLREWSPDEDRRPYREFWEAVMGEKLPTVPLKGDAELDIIMRDRLIHLLGGDEPNFAKIAETIKWGDECEDKLMENGKNHKIANITNNMRCVKTATKTYDGTPPNDDGTCPNTVLPPSITDELREFKGHINAGLTPEMVLALRAEINCIADRIEEQFARICEQQEAVLQDTIDGAAKRLKDAEKQLEEANAAIANYKMRDESFAESERMREELQAKLDEYDKTHVELPRGKDGKHIRMGDTVQYEHGEPFEVTRVVIYDDDTVWVSDGDEYGDMSAEQLHHADVDGDTVEAIVRELTLDSTTKQELIDKLREVMDGRR